jgi:hypothetical protein
VFLPCMPGMGRCVRVCCPASPQNLLPLPVAAAATGMYTATESNGMQQFSLACPPGEYVVSIYGR